MNRFFLITILILGGILVNKSLAQGIDGRRIMVNYDLQWAGNFRSTLNELTNGTEGVKWANLYLKPHLVHSFELNFVASRKWEIGPDFQFYRLGVIDLGNGETPFLLKNRELGFHIQKFQPLRGALAPVGHWWKIRYYQTRGVATLTNNDSYAGTIWKPGMTLSVGKQIIINKYILFNTSFGIDFGIGELRSEENSYIDVNRKESLINDVIQSHRFMFITMGIGWNAGLK